MSWNVSPMVKDASPAEVNEMLQKIVKEIEVQSERFDDAISIGSPDRLLKVFKEAEQLWIKEEDIVVYCELRYYAETTDKEALQLNEWAQQTRSKTGQLRKPLEIKLGKLLLEKPELLTAPELKDYIHFMEKLKRQAPYYLTPQEETLLIAKDVNGIKIMSQLQESWVSEKTFDIEVKGEKKTVPYTVLSAMRMDPDRQVREMASRTLYKSFADDKLLHGSALRSICADHVAIVKRRGMPSSMTQSLLDQDVDENTITSLLTAIESTSDKFQEYLKLKAKSMGLDKLAGFDVIAPVSTDPVWKFDWPGARNIVIESFRSFDGAIGDVIEDMFNGRRIDAANRVGKTSGAFCAWWPGERKSFILQTFNGTMNDVFTLAHENGHAGQGHMTYNAQIVTNWDTSACMAETGSIFGELLLTEKLLGMSKSDEERLETLWHVLGDFYYTVYYVGARALFEKSLYDAIDEGQLIDADTACDLWNTAKGRVFGDSVEWSDHMEYEWARIPHHFIPNYRFYNYPYSFAQMLVYALYESYKAGDSQFNEQFRKLLAAGCSISPRDQIALVGHDLTDPKFWKLGAKQADRFMNELKKLV